MRTIIAGSRGCTDPAVLWRGLGRVHWPITRVISGHAMGADTLGELAARAAGVPLDVFPARWREHGRWAGRLRNAEMLQHADALLALWDGKSRGTKHMVDIARQAGLLVHVERYAATA